MTNILGKQSADNSPNDNDSQRVTGVVKWFSRLKGYGFVTSGDGDEVFVHYSAIEGESPQNLCEGDRVSYLVVDRGKGLQAMNVKKILP
jgi:cold shock protein